jgi:hypothetical protein
MHEVLAETLLTRCPHSTIIATSRESLRIQGEQIYRVPPLEVPAAGSRSVLCEIPCSCPIVDGRLAGISSWIP